MFGKRLRQVRMLRHYTQQFMADSLCVSLNAYQKYEQGERMPSLDTLVRIADILGTSTDYLLERDYYLRAIGIDPTKIE